MRVSCEETMRGFSPDLIVISSAICMVCADTYKPGGIDR